MESCQYDPSDIPDKVAKTLGFPESGTKLKDKTHVSKYLDVLDKARPLNKIKRFDAWLKGKKYPLGLQRFGCSNCQGGFTMYFSDNGSSLKEKTGSVSIGDFRPCSCEIPPPIPKESTNNTIQGSVWDDKKAWQAGAIHEYIKQGFGIVETQKRAPQDFAGEQETLTSRIIRMYCKHTDGKWSVVRCRRRDSPSGIITWTIEKFPNLPEEAYGPTNEPIKSPAVNKKEITFDCHFCGEVEKKYGQFQFACCSDPKDESKNLCNSCLRVTCFARKTDPTTHRFQVINKCSHAKCSFCNRETPEYIRVEDGEVMSRHDCPCPYGWLGNRPFLSQQDYEKHQTVFDEKVKPLVISRTVKKEQIDILENRIADLENFMSRSDINKQQFENAEKDIEDSKVRLHQGKDELAAVEKSFPQWCEGPSYKIPMHMLPRIPSSSGILVENSDDSNSGAHAPNIVAGGTLSAPIVLDDDDDDTESRPTSRQRRH